MNRISTGLSLAAAIGLAATLSAQTASTTTAKTDKDHDVTVTGCLSKAAGGFMLNNARVETGASSSTTTASGTTTAGSSTTSATGTSGTTPAAGASGAAMSWMLTGDSDLEKHVGHKIQVTGKTTWDESMDHNRSAASTSTSTTTTTKSGPEPSLDVKSIKMISSSCS
jgi:hypothetical protein